MAQETVNPMELVDPFSGDNKAVLMDFRDLVDCLDYLMRYLENTGIIKNREQFLVDFRQNLESRINVRGSLTETKYNVEVK